MYISEKETFAENVLHKEIDYYREIKSYLPIIYLNSNFQVTKILTDFDNLKKIQNNRKYNINQKWFKKIQKQYYNKNNIFFINVPKNKIEKIQWVWESKQLPTIIGKKTDQGILSGKISGVLSFGPYIKLTAGEYNITIDYISPNVENRKIGTWDIAIAQKTVKKGDIFGTNNNNFSIISNFNINMYSKNKPVEIRTFFNDGKIIMNKITLTQIKSYENNSFF